MAVSMRDLDPAFQGAGQKAYPLSYEFFIMMSTEVNVTLIRMLEYFESFCRLQMTVLEIYLYHALKNFQLFNSFVVG